ncbi:MAG: hypothetical protein IT427_02135 [Pirellulales bacterium]|nr:hypothetical protein [Pirellulales bacterium]
MKFDVGGLGAARRLRGGLRRWTTLAMAFALLAAGSASTRPALRAAEPAAKSTTSRAAREDALRALPLKQLRPEMQAKVAAVLNDTSIFRRLPTQTIDCDPALFQFLVTNPDIVVNIWRSMGVTSVSMDRLDADHFRAADGDGTTCTAEFVYRDHDTNIIYGEGTYEGPLFPRPVRGQCVAMLKTAEIRETNGRYYITARLDLFLHVENAGVELLAKMFQGWLGKTIDHNFTETVAFLGNVSSTSETNPQGMRKLAGRLNHVDEDRRSQFALVIEQVAGNLSAVSMASQQPSKKTRP